MKEALRKNEYKKLSTEEYEIHTKEYTSTRRVKIIKEWEENTHQKWPVDKNGQWYQLHHIIEQQYGGQMSGGTAIQLNIQINIKVESMEKIPLVENYLINYIYDV